MSARILIVTAAFGEGHNSAARNLALALDNLGATTLVADPCLLGAPVSTNAICKAYRLVTTHAPGLWHRIYRSTGKVDFSRQRMPLMRKPENKLAELVAEFQPDAIVATYPIYPYFLDRILEDRADPPPVFTVVTDSVEINSAWIDAPTTAWIVTDAFTRDSMVKQGIPVERIIETGFPVNPSFSQLPFLPADSEIDPFQVLYFATPKLPHVRRTSKAVLNADPRTQITIVLGKNFRLLYDRAKEIKDRFPGRVRIRGWTRKVPELLCKHHLVIGKAGGATVHEAIAARCPMLVHHLVPGQEEGNLQLLEKIGGGTLANSPEAITRLTTDLLADKASRWRQMKRALEQHGHHSGATTAAHYILKKCDG
ncbi:MGDG synthase family glycosyltransferase [Haloferula sp.]|uniref:MGDG synthase family glycosyltransferase n=1 Tax=Haloferula sp. TaxID=2497595 RepID=UPI003C771BEC